jgi:hypothetical protein
MNVLEKFHLTTAYQDGILTGRTEQDLYLSLGKDFKIKRTDSQELYNALKEQHDTCIALGAFAVSELRLQHAVEKLALDVLRLAYRFELSNPSDIRDHSTDIMNVVQGIKNKGASFRMYMVQLIEKLDNPELLARAKELFPLEYETATVRG